MILNTDTYSSLCRLSTDADGYSMEWHRGDSDRNFNLPNHLQPHLTGFVTFSVSQNFLFFLSISQSETTIWPYLLICPIEEITTDCFSRLLTKHVTSMQWVAAYSAVTFDNRLRSLQPASSVWVTVKVHVVVVGKPEIKTGRPTGRLVDNNKTDLKKKPMGGTWTAMVRLRIGTSGRRLWTCL